MKEDRILDFNFTTNAEDLKAAAALKAHLTIESLRQVNDQLSYTKIPSVSIDEGAHKYVLISATVPCNEDEQPYRQYFVVSKKGASYHQNVAQGFVPQLKAAGYTNIEIQGGGRILHDKNNAKIHIFGFSYGFGLGDHAQSKKVIESDSRYHTYEITWSNDGY